MKRMLQHSSKCNDEAYLRDELKPRYERLLAECRRRLRLVDGLNATETGGDIVSLPAANRMFFCHRWVLAMYSPVLRQMLYGEFVESNSLLSNVLEYIY